MMEDRKPIKWSTFLWDVFVCSMGAYGGPEAHYGVFAERMVHRKGYVTDAELGEYIALTSIVPGPSSTQTILAIGYQTGGPVLALLTFLVWALPAVTLLTVLSFLYQYLSEHQISPSVLRYIAPTAVGFIAMAAIRIGSKAVKGKLDLLLFLSVVVVTYFFHTGWLFPLLLGLGGLFAVLRSKERNLWNRVTLKPPYRYLVLFAVIAAGALLSAALLDNRLVWLFERFYRYGYLIIGGGQVVVPFMYGDLVEVRGFMTSQEFLTGYGLVQGLPGPMFSFSAYAGGMAARGGSAIAQVAGALVSAAGIFLPGVLLMYFVLPVWEQLKGIRGIRVALGGITVVAAGLIASAGIVLMRDSGLRWDNLLVALGATALLAVKKVPAPAIVALAILLGILF